MQVLGDCVTSLLCFFDLLCFFLKPSVSVAASSRALLIAVFLVLPFLVVLVTVGVSLTVSVSELVFIGFSGIDKMSIPSSSGTESLILIVSCILAFDNISFFQIYNYFLKKRFIFKTIF
jgi:hypothetical protein